MDRLETGRLVLRRLTLEHAPFILGLVNDPDWLRFIGDKGVRTLEDARDYLRKGPLAMYVRLGFGLCLVELKEDAAPIGLCGLIKRDSLPGVDLGFALLPAFRGRGYAREAAAAALGYARGALGLSRLLAIVSPDNERSIKLLKGLGFVFEKKLELADCYHLTFR